MNNAELLERYNELYETMATSGDPKKMKLFGEAEKWAFAQLVNMNPRAAAIWLQKLEAVDWNNYLSEEEALEIAGKFVDKEGKTGPMWTASQVDSAVRSFDGQKELMPFYNGWALYVTMNMMVSDHMGTMKEFIPDSEVPRMAYMLAVDKLTDPDKTDFVRDYFGM